MEMYKCPIYVDDDGILRDCKCWKYERKTKERELAEEIHKNIEGSDQGLHENEVLWIIKFRGKALEAYKDQLIKKIKKLDCSIEQGFFKADVLSIIKEERCIKH